jgi:hypothetical protein
LIETRRGFDTWFGARRMTLIRCAAADRRRRGDRDRDRAGMALTLLFERHVARTVAQDLEVHLKQPASIDLVRMVGSS